MSNTKLVFVTCHRLPERSFFWKGKQFPICARCTGLYIGYLSFILFNFEIITLRSVFAFLLVLPTVLDGLLQAFYKVPSTNTRRVITGMIAGVGLMAIVVNIGTLIGNFLLK
ncbi:MAG: DUF2085 domain-containing protein [Ferruginibacter sp.]